MEEEWKDIEGFPGYQVSNKGQVRSFYEKKKAFGRWGGVERILHDKPQRTLLQSDDGNGYMKVFLQNDQKRRCVKVHRLVAEAFIPRKEGCDTVDHIKPGPEGKLDNSVENLRWIPRRENIQKAYSDGVCDSRIDRSKVPVMVTDEWSGEEKYYESVRAAAEAINRHQSSISHAISKSGIGTVSHYTIEKAGEEDIMLYGNHGYDEDYGYY